MKKPLVKYTFCMLRPLARSGARSARRRFKKINFYIFVEIEGAAGTRSRRAGPRMGCKRTVLAILVDYTFDVLCTVGVLTIV